MHFRLAAALAALCLTTTLYAEPITPERSGQWLLNGLKSLADEGALFNSMNVEHVLDLKILAEARQLVSQPSDCSSDWADKSRIATSYSSKPGWFKPSLEGVQDMKVPAFTINRAGVSGNPAFSYQETAVVNCSGKFSLDQSKQARLSFDGLPAFACFHRDYLVKALHATHHFATDGVDFVDYYGQTNDHFATNLEFVFRAGANCALSATLSQDTDGGYRYLRAQANWGACKVVADRNFCSISGHFSWGDGKKIDEMEEAAVKSCGTITSFYAREPLSGQLPPAIPARRFSQGPCPD